MITFRHVGRVVKDLEEAKLPYLEMGFKEVDRETLQILKLSDPFGNVIELIQGKWHDHLCVNFYETKEGEYFEVFHHNCHEINRKIISRKEKELTFSIP